MKIWYSRMPRKFFVAKIFETLKKELLLCVLLLFLLPLLLLFHSCKESLYHDETKVYSSPLGNL